MATATRPPIDLQDAHPLELIPFFRRYPPGALRDVGYTFLWNTLIAVAFTVIALLWSGRVGVVRLFWVNFVFAQCIGYAIHLLFALVEAAGVRRRCTPAAWRVVHFAGIPVVGVVVGYWIGASLLGWVEFRSAILTPRGLASLAALSLLLSGLLAAVMLPRERAARAEAAMANERARAAAAEREAAIAHMKALEAQVEPHFLYNTLAHVASLIEADPRAARDMLDRLIGLMRDTARAGTALSSLGAQAGVVRAWLGILALRMGARLDWAVDVPDDLADAEVPPALLQPLVENAVKHGLEPKVEGGRVEVSARRDGDALVVVVADSGVGFGHPAPPFGGSTRLGLDGLRARLAALHGGAASLVVVERAGGGVAATVRLPLRGVS